MKALLFQLLFLSAFVVVAAAIAVLRANASESGLRSDSDTIPAAIEEERGVGANERELFYYRQYSQEPTSSCDALYFRYMSGETQSLLRSVCTYSGLVQYKLGDISTISNNRPVSTAAGSGLTSAENISGNQFQTDLSTFPYAEILAYCRCRALQEGCETADSCKATERTLHTANLGQIVTRFGRQGSGSIDDPAQASALLSYAQQLPADKCLALCV